MISGQTPILQTRPVHVMSIVFATAVGGGVAAGVFAKLTWSWLLLTLVVGFAAGVGGAVVTFMVVGWKAKRRERSRRERLHAAVADAELAIRCPSAPQGKIHCGSETCRLGTFVGQAEAAHQHARGYVLGAIAGGLHPGAVTLALLTLAADGVEHTRKIGELPALLRACAAIGTVDKLMSALLVARPVLFEVLGLPEPTAGGTAAASGADSGTDSDAPAKAPEVLH